MRTDGERLHSMSVARGVWAVLLVLGMVLVGGCTFEAAEFGGIGRKFAEPAFVPAGQGVIYFYRLPAAFGCGAIQVIKVNDVDGVVAVTNGGWFDYVTPPGHYDIHDRPSARFVTTYHKKASVDLKAGEAVYVRFRPKEGAASMAALGEAFRTLAQTDTWKDIDSGFVADVVPPEQALREMKGLGKFSVAGGVDNIGR